MKLIQSYCTFGGENLNAGFTTLRSFKKFLSESYPIHSTIYDDFKIITDAEGYEVIKTIVHDSHIKVIDFPIIDDRWFNIGKLQAQQTINEPYIHIDLDVKLFDVIETDYDVICEMTRGICLGKEYNDIKSFVPICLSIPCSGIIGFNDMRLKEEYLSNTISIIKASRLREVKFDHLWIVEEMLLGSMIKNQGKSLYEVNKHNDYIHLQGKQK